MSRLLNRLIIAILALAIVAPVLPVRAADQFVGKASTTGGNATKEKQKKHKKKHKKKKHNKKKHHKAKAHHKRKHRRRHHHKRRRHRKSTSQPTK